VEPHPVDFELGRSKSSSVEVVQLNRHVPRGHLCDVSVVRVEPSLAIDVAGQAIRSPLEPENVPLGEIHAAVLELLLLLRSLSGVVHKRLGALLTWSAVLQPVVLAVLDPFSRVRPDDEHRVVGVSALRAGLVRADPGFPAPVLGPVELGGQAAGVAVRAAGDGEAAVRYRDGIRSAPAVARVPLAVVDRPELSVDRVAVELVDNVRSAPVWVNRRLLSA